MNITLDSVLTVAIGRNQQDGTPLADTDWNTFQRVVGITLERHGGIVVAHTHGGGIGSDGGNAGVLEESAVFVAINIDDLLGARRDLAPVLKAFGQSSACFAFDMAHEPVFATTDGFRPSLPDPGLEAWLEEGHGRRTQP